MSIHVKIGEVKVGKEDDILKAILGSCVGIAFIWKRKGVCALAHCLLAESLLPINEIGAKYVNQAIASLMILLKIRQEDIGEIEVFIAGGGNMMAQLARANKDHIGQLNLNAARKHLDKAGFKFKELDVAGDVGRIIQVDCSVGTVSVINLKKE